MLSRTSRRGWKRTLCPPVSPFVSDHSLFQACRPISFFGMEAVVSGGVV